MNQTLENCTINHLETAMEILNTRKSARNFIKDLEEEIRYNIFIFKKFGNSMVDPETK